MVVFIGCVKSKRNTEQEAKNLYKSDLFKKSLAYAESLNPRKIYILSAKYGVLELNQRVKPYEKTLNKMTKAEKKKWAYGCYAQLKAKGQDFNEKAVFLCGQNYRGYLSQVFRNATCPLQGVPFGKQLKFYKENTKK